MPSLPPRIAPSVVEGVESFCRGRSVLLRGGLVDVGAIVQVQTSLVTFVGVVTWEMTMVM